MAHRALECSLAWPEKRAENEKILQQICEGQLSKVEGLKQLMADAIANYDKLTAQQNGWLEKFKHFQDQNLPKDETMALNFTCDVCQSPVNLKLTKYDTYYMRCDNCAECGSVYFFRRRFSQVSKGTTPCKCGADSFYFKNAEVVN